MSGRLLDPLEVAWLETKIAEKFSTKGDFYAAYQRTTGRTQDPERQLQRILNSEGPITPPVRITFAKTLGMTIEELDAGLRECLRVSPAYAADKRLLSFEQLFQTFPSASTSHDLQIPKRETVSAVLRAFSNEFRTAHQKFEALTNKALDDEAADLVVELGRQSATAEKHAEAAFWFAKAASAFRRQGKLDFAGEYHGRAGTHLKLAIRNARNNPKAISRLLAMELELEFGRVHGEDFLDKGDFDVAEKHHDKLIHDADVLLARPLEAEVAAEVRLHRIHSKRQKAQMQKYMGNYNFALRLIREVQSLYPESADLALYYSELTEADSLRLLGRLEEADKIYDRLQEIGERRSDGLLESVLWRRACALQLLQNRKTLSAVLGRMHKLREQTGSRHKYFGIYSCLVRATDSLPSAARIERFVKEAIKIGDLSELHGRTEYAHCVLLRAEARRSTGKNAAANFAAALKLYRQMPMNWGIVRAWIGLHLSGGNDSDIPCGLQGRDRQIFDDSRRGKVFAPGALVIGIP